MKQREQRFFNQMDLGATATEIKRAAKTLRSVRSALGGKR